MRLSLERMVLCGEKGLKWTVSNVHFETPEEV
jgi:hypothetical protein